MKTSVLLFFLVLMAYAVKSQDLTLAIQFENTVAGAQSGATMMYETKGAFAIGGFYQRDIQPSRELHALNAFYGAQIQVPLVRSERLLFAGILRTGLVNEFVVVVPGLETRINIRKRFAVAISSSMRMNYAALSGKVIVKLF
jgi:hypothetical protein